MRRDRVELPGTRYYENVEKFLYSRPRRGAHAIRLGAQWLDVLYEDRGAATTLVVFHGAASPRIRKLPYFTGRGTAEALGWNLIAVSDPSLALGDVDLAWFLGNRPIGLLPPLLAPVIQHLLGENQPVLMGGSGGGYAAILYGQYFPDSQVVAMNPRLNMLARPEPAVLQYLEACHKSSMQISWKAIRRKYVVENLADEYAAGLPFDLHLIQNSGDTLYLRHQAQPFIDQHRDDPRLHVTLEDFGRGHRGIPTDFLHNYLQGLGVSV